MDIRQLKYFMAIAREGQVTAAAKQLNMEQPAAQPPIEAGRGGIGSKAVRPKRQTLEADRSRQTAAGKRSTAAQSI
ncbi:hypothetical protein GCM10010911_39230 [Paenibacillus nasutitermitis]|uniref:HTH lysR-type domain-containing protein n=1 Tax=Paenibacillus nasutitermitis TaxID=1652958 RepID=A0A916Z651_9BACL|nr:hypothetical protein GCM10010911_39230 [Paenibacillus nasutitermitis]